VTNPLAHEPRGARAAAGAGRDAQVRRLAVGLRVVEPLAAPERERRSGVLLLLLARDGGDADADDGALLLGDDAWWVGGFGVGLDWDGLG
jgi:hypothetical protein